MRLEENFLFGFERVELDIEYHSEDNPLTEDYLRILSLPDGPIGTIFSILDKNKKNEAVVFERGGYRIAYQNYKKPCGYISKSYPEILN